MADKPRKRRGPRKATASHLRNAALQYLERFATSSANLRRVLMRKVERSARHHGTDAEQGTGEVDALIARFEAAGLLDDAAYAAAQVDSLRRRGASARAAWARLLAKGLTAEIAEAALADHGAGSPDAEWAAAVVLARRRRLGPYRVAGDREEMREKDLAALARAGFSYDIARRMVAAGTVEEVEAEADPSAISSWPD